MNNKYPLITKWLPELDVINDFKKGYEIISADDLERELAKGVRVNGRGEYGEGAWLEPKSLAATHEALLIGARPIVKERKAMLTESQVRELLIASGMTNAALKLCIERLFGEGES